MEGTHIVATRLDVEQDRNERTVGLVDQRSRVYVKVQGSDGCAENSVNE